MYWRIHLGLLPGREAEFAEYWPRSELANDFVQLVEGQAGSTPLPKPLASNPLAPAGLALTTLQDARYIRADTEWRAIPGLYYHPATYHVSGWLPRIDHRIPVVNRGGLFVPAALLPYVTEPLWPAVFVRPDSGLKPFSGWSFSTAGMTTWTDVYQEVMRVQPHISPDQLLFIAAGKQIAALEWRFWIADRKVIASSPYSWEEDLVTWVPPPAGALAIADAMARNQWQPDLSYVVDVVKVAGGYALNEINATSTSGLYSVPFSDLFPALRDVAMREWTGELSQTN